METFILTMIICTLIIMLVSGALGIFMVFYSLYKTRWALKDFKRKVNQFTDSNVGEVVMNKLIDKKSKFKYTIEDKNIVIVVRTDTFKNILLKKLHKKLKQEKKYTMEFNTYHNYIEVYF